MKKKSARGVNRLAILEFLSKHGPTSASDIQKATKVKGNIYTTMQTMAGNKLVKKVGKLYEIERRMSRMMLSYDKVSPLPETLNKQEHVDPRVKVYEEEIHHIKTGIEQLETTERYLRLRVKELLNEQAQSN